MDIVSCKFDSSIAETGRSVKMLDGARASKSAGRLSTFVLITWLLSVGLFPYMFSGFPIGTEDADFHVRLTDQYAQNSTIQGTQDHLRGTVSKDFSGTPPGLYVLGVSLAKLSGLGSLDASTVVSFLVFFAIMVGVFAVAMRLSANNRGHAALVTLAVITIPAAYLHYFQYATSNVAMVFFLGLVLSILSLGGRIVGNAISLTLMLSIAFSHVGTFVFLLLFLPLLAFATAVLSPRRKGDLYGRSLLAGAGPFVYVAYATVFPYSQDAFLTRFLVSVETRVHSIMGNLVDPILEIFYRLFESNSLEAALGIGVASAGLALLVGWIGPLIGNFGLGGVRARWRTALQVFPFPVGLPAYLERNIVYLVLLLGPIQMATALFAWRAILPREDRATLVSLGGVGFLSGLAAVGSNVSNPREFTFVWLFIGWAGGTGMYLLLFGRTRMLRRTKRLFGVASVLGLFGSTAVAGLIYLPSISVLPAEAETAVWISTSIESNTTVLVPNFGAHLGNRNAAFTVPSDSLVLWNSASTDLYRGYPNSKKTLVEWFDTLYAVHSDKVARISGIAGDPEDSRSYVIYAMAGEHLRVFYIL